MAKSKLRRVLGSQKQRSGELRGRLGVGPGGLWAGSGRSREVRGGPPRNFGIDLLFFSFLGRNKYEKLPNKSFPSGSAETGAE